MITPLITQNALNILRAENAKIRTNPENTTRRLRPKLTCGTGDRKQDTKTDTSIENNSLNFQGEEHSETKNIAPGINVPEPIAPEPPENGNMDEFKSLNNEFDELNRLVNISVLLKAVKDLNAQLRTCRTPKDIFETYRKFYDNLNSYNFKN